MLWFIRHFRANIVLFKTYWDQMPSERVSSRSHTECKKVCADITDSHLKWNKSNLEFSLFNSHLNPIPGSLTFNPIINLTCLLRLYLMIGISLALHLEQRRRPQWRQWCLLVVNPNFACVGCIKNTFHVYEGKMKWKLRACHNNTWHSSQTSPSPHLGSADSKSSNLHWGPMRRGMH